MPGIPTVGATVGILLTTFLVIGECNLPDSRISVLALRNISSSQGLSSWVALVAAQMATWAVAKNIDHQ